MFNVVLVNPEIPPNTGNIIRLCANSGATLHIIEPTGFTLDNKRMKRAGLDYHEFAKIQTHKNWEFFLAHENPKRNKLYAFSTKGNNLITSVNFQKDDWFIFGSETGGLHKNVLTSINDQQICRLPMKPKNRSLNLSNAVAITVYEAWRQHNYEGGI